TARPRGERTPTCKEEELGCSDRPRAASDHHYSSHLSIRGRRIKVEVMVVDHLTVAKVVVLVGEIWPPSQLYHSQLNLGVNNSYCPMRHTSYDSGGIRAYLCRGIVPPIPFVMATPSTPKGSSTPKYPSLHSKHPVDKRLLLQVINKE
ncbi:hypothetical protein CR513_60661, partial [Mucuna pruriens]